jgi:hypothetical protein
MTRRLGRIFISTELISPSAKLEDLEVMQRVFNNLLVLDVLHTLGDQTSEYVVMSLDETFDEVQPGEMIPEYQVIVTLTPGEKYPKHKFVKQGLVKLS